MSSRPPLRRWRRSDALAQGAEGGAEQIGKRRQRRAGGFGGQLGEDAADLGRAEALKDERAVGGLERLRGDVLVNRLNRAYVLSVARLLSRRRHADEDTALMRDLYVAFEAAGATKRP